ncbi:MULTISPECIES: hypothetical protein [unclassified Streptomyces]|uniref:hypothetical protein n=1 Tax=unclassified Streptomyces TaxID=2593676 RepID=UPI00336A2AC1
MTGEELTSADAQPRSVDRRKALLLGGAAAVVLALVAGLLVWLTSSDDDESTKALERNRKPFVEALSELAEARGLHYKDTAMVGITERDVMVTASGTVFGHTGDGVESLDRDVLRIGGKTYTRWKKGRDYEAPDGKQKDPDAPGRWTIGSPGESYTLDPVMAQYLPPSDLAFKLLGALDQLDELPDPSDPGLPSLTVGGVPALAADTSAGRLVVSKNKPYRVLRLEPYDLRDQIKDARKQLEAGATPSVAPRVTTGPLKDGDSQGMELSPLVGEQADAMYDTLEQYAKQLNGAVDDGVDFTLDGSGKLNCGSGGCSVVQKFTGKLSTEAKARITGGTVTATMSATISIDGQPAGGCTVPSRTFPLTGNSVSGSLSCSAPEAGPVFAAADAKAKAQAEQQARASGGRVTVRFYSRANTLIDARALAVGEVDRLVDQVGRERRSEPCLTGKSSASGVSAQLAGGHRPMAQPILSGRSHTLGDTAAERPSGTVPVFGDLSLQRGGGCLPALRDWNSQRFQFGNQTFLLDKKGMEHILTRHHPKYWDGSTKKDQSFFDSRMSVKDVQNAIGEVLRQNREKLVQRGSRGMYQIQGKVDGVEYVLGLNRGRVGQFYPKGE